MNQKLVFRLFVVGLAAALLYWGIRPDRTGGALDYQTQSLSKGSIESVVNAAGAINPVVTVDVGSELSGVISALHADFNTEVTKGQLIARLDDRTIRARLQQAEADLAMSEASVEQQAASIKKADAQLTRARIQHKRQTELLLRKLTSQAEVDDSLAALQVAEADLSLSQSQLSGGKAQIMQRQAQLKQASLELERTYIRSPVSGIVINRQVDVGQTVAASLSAPVLYSIAQDLSLMQIEADVDEADIGKMKEGQAVRFKVDAYPSRSFGGEVSQVRKASSIVSNVVTYKVIIDAQNKDYRLLPGMTANVDFILGEQKNVLRVPNSALRFRPANVGERKANASHPLVELIRKLSLSARQKTQVDSLVAAFLGELQVFRDSNANQPGNRGSQMRQMRQKLFNGLKIILTEEQYASVESAGRSQRSRGAAKNYARGEVWVLRDGEPKKIDVRVGLSNDEYTELVSEQLKEGDDVIVRVSRKPSE